MHMFSTLAFVTLEKVEYSTYAQGNKLNTIYILLLDEKHSQQFFFEKKV